MNQLKNHMHMKVPCQICFNKNRMRKAPYSLFKRVLNFLYNSLYSIVLFYVILYLVLSEAIIISCMIM